MGTDMGHKCLPRATPLDLMRLGLEDNKLDLNTLAEFKDINKNLFYEVLQTVVKEKDYVCIALDLGQSFWDLADKYARFNGVYYGGELVTLIEVAEAMPDTVWREKVQVSKEEYIYSVMCGALENYQGKAQGAETAKEAQPAKDEIALDVEIHNI